MQQQNGPWTITQSREVYQNQFIEVIEDQVIQPDGEPGMYSTVTLRAGVSVLPIVDDGTVYLIRQFRYGIGKDSIEVASGMIDGDEPPLEAAKRELCEELGIEADEWIDLGAMDMDTSIVRCPLRLYLAKRLRFSTPEREGTETMKTVKLGLDQAIQKVFNSEITHGPSCVLLMKAYYAQVKDV